MESGPQEEERTIVRVGNRTFWVELLGGVKPEGAEKVIGAFVNGRVRYDSDDLKDEVSRIDLTQPTWLTTGDGENWINFSHASQNTLIKFQLNGDEVTVHKVTGHGWTARYE